MFDREVAGRFLRLRQAWLIAAILVALAAWWFSGSKRAAPTGPPAGMAQLVPVRVETARVEDLDIYLKGLGTVTAFNTVTVRSRVQGELVKVLFKEGEQVKAGTLLAEIDPRSFAVALSQAIGMQQQNESQNENAKRD